jgi:hypothetical protein
VVVAYLELWCGMCKGGKEKSAGRNVNGNFIDFILGKVPQLALQSDNRPFPLLIAGLDETMQLIPMP